MKWPILILEWAVLLCLFAILANINPRCLDLDNE